MGQVMFINLSNYNVFTREEEMTELIPRPVASTTDTFQHKDDRFGPKVGQIGPKWDKSGKFSDQISIYFFAR